MKRKINVFIAIIGIVSMLAAVGCEERIEYQMGECNTDGIIYDVPLHFAISENEEADDYYVTVNSTLAVYSYTYGEFGSTFGYNGDFTAIDVAEHIVSVRNYNCTVSEGASIGSAKYSFLYTDYNNNYYSTSTVHVTAERVYVLVFSCFSDKLDRYQDMIIEIMNSVRFE